MSLALFSFSRRPTLPKLFALLFGFSGLVQGQVVISQVYGGGGNSGATYKNDFIELFNRGPQAVSLSGWTVQYTSSGGTSWTNSTPLSGAIQPGGYYLIQEAAGSGGTTSLPAPDAVGSISMSGSSGKVALVNTTTALIGSCPTGGGIQDFVGYGSANCYEGTGPAPMLSNTTAALRGGGGSSDTNNNAADFTAGAPSPRNGGGSGPPPCVPTTLISTIQGTGIKSPLEGNVVSTSGVVTARRSNGFFIQMPAGDGNPATSDGLFIFTSSTPPADATVANLVCVSGTVQEYPSLADPASLSQTEISSLSALSIISTGNPLPAPVLIGPADLTPSGGAFQLEKYDGMRVQVSALTVTGPTRGSIDEKNATATSNGIFYGVFPGTARAFREAGIQLPGTLPATWPSGIPRWDGNPEVLSVNSAAQPGSTALDVTTGQTVNNIVGPLELSGGVFTIDTDPGNPPLAAASPAPMVARAVPNAAESELSVASVNLQRFFDTTDDPATSDAVLTAQAFQNRLAKASLAVRNVLKTPDVIGVAEVENLATLEAVAAQVSADATAAGQADPQYAAYLVEGNDIGGIDVGFLTKKTVHVLDVTQVGKDTTFLNPTTGTQDMLNDRPPLVLRATITRSGSDQPLPFTVIMNHLRSLSDVDNPTDGRVRAKRQAQAEFLANYIQGRQAADPNENILSIGDYNAYQFSDGYVDVMGTVEGAPTPSDQVVLASGDLVNPNLTDLTDSAPPEERYSYSFNGSAQELDHILVNAALAPKLSRYAVARNGSDFPETYRNDPARPERISDHDWPVAYFNLPLNHTPVASPQTVTIPFNTVTTFALDASDPDSGDALTFATVNAPAKGTVSYDNAAHAATYSPAADATGSDSFTYSATDNGGLHASATVTIQIAGVATSTVVSPAAAQYSDAVTLTAAVTPTSAGAQQLAGTVSFAVDGAPAGSAAVNGTGAGSVSYTISLAAGSHNVTAQFASSNAAFANSSGSGTLTVTRENASVTLSPSNPQSVQVGVPGGTASVTLAASIRETPDGSPGDISFAAPVNCTLTPVLNGATVSAPAAVSGGGVGGTLLASCAFPKLAVNDYAVQIAVGGDYYTGSAQSALSVFDSSAGFVTGGGVIFRSGSEATFAISAKYLKNGRLQGDFSWLEHRSGPDVVIQSTAIQSLSIVGNAAVVVGEASVNGTPHYGFQVVAVNNGSPGIHHDQLALQITNPDGTARSDLSFPLTLISGGNIQLH